MKILAVADEKVPQLYDFFDPEKFPKIDLMLGCGDLDAKYLSYLMGAIIAPTYYVKGNHDVSYSEKPPLGGEDIDGKLIKHNGISIMGVEGSMWYNGKPLQYTQTRMKLKLLRMYPKLWLNRGVDIVIAHAPVKDHHDGDDICHTGFQAFYDLIVKYQPKYFLHGHMHMNYRPNQKRAHKIGNTWVINCSGYYVFDYENGPDNRDVWSE